MRPNMRPWIGAGAAPAWKPTSIGGCTLWLRGDLGVTKDGSNKVSRWADQGGEGSDATQSDGDKQFIWYDSQINGHPALLSDGIDDFMDLESGAFPSSSLSAFAVVKFLVNSGNHMLCGRIYDSVGFDWRLNSTPFMVLRFGDAGADVRQLTQNTVATENWYLLEAMYDSSGPSMYQYTNGGSENSGTGPSSLAYGAGDIASIGAARKAGAATWFSNFYVAEIIVYNSYLSVSNRQIVEGYLNGRYAIY